MAESKRKLAAILSADVVGYSRLMQDDEAATVETLTKYRSVFSDLVARHDGRIVDSPGDNVLCEFESPVEAVQCAVEVQRELGRRNRQLAEHRQMHFRIGINLGDVITRDDGTIYGDGVNVAARLEALAEPGGIMISETAQMQVHSLIDVGIADAGEHEVKNMERPVHAYQIVLDGAAPAAPPIPRSALLRWPIMTAVVILLLGIGGLVFWFVDTGSISTTDLTTTIDPVFAVPTGPSIAVLPFDNLSGEAEQEYFAGSLTEELILALSRFQDLKTIGRHSTMQYKGQGADAREIGRDLGVDFVFQGSVRRGPDKLRIAAQLIDTQDGSHIWSESYERTATVDDLFTIQDDVTKRIVATIADRYGVIGRRLAKQSSARTPQDWKSYECVALVHRTLGDELTPENLRNSITCMEEVTAADPGYADGWGFLAEMYAFAIVLFGWDTPPDLLDRSFQAGLKGVEADPYSPQAHWGLASAHFYRGELQQFKEEANAALALNPNSPHMVGTIGWGLWHSGEWDRGIALIEKAYKLNPQGPRFWLYPVAWNHFRLGEYEEALAVANRIKLPEYFDPLIRAAILGQLGRTTEANAALADAIELQPDTPERIREYLTPWLPDSELVERALDGLYKAGLKIPDEPSASD